MGPIVQPGSAEVAKVLRDTGPNSNVASSITDVHAEIPDESRRASLPKVPSTARPLARAAAGAVPLVNALPEARKAIADELSPLEGK